MSSRRRHRSSSRSSREYRVPQVVESGQGFGDRRRRRSRHRLSRRLKARLLAGGFGFLLLAMAGAFFGWLVVEHGDRHPDDPVAAAAEDLLPSAPTAPPDPPSPAEGSFAVVTCPGADKAARSAPAAAACGDAGMLRVLLGQPGAAHTPDPRPEFAGRTALHHAAQLGDTRSMGILLAAGADPNTADAQGNTPLHLVATNPRLKHPEFTARRLIDAGARLDLRNARERTALQELETDHQRVLAQQNLAMVLFQGEREALMAQWLTPTVPSGEKPLALPSPPPAEESVVIDTAQGRIRIPVDAPGAGAEP
jgi:hypothetical protein